MGFVALNPSYGPRHFYEPMHFEGRRRVRFHHIIAATWLALACAIAPAHAEKRVALVIGNDRYANLPGQQLRKAVSDARAVGAALQQIGFEVIAGENLGRGALVDKLDELTRRLAPGDTAFFFFSGHGVALDGVNYILPADVPDIAPGQETRMKLAALGESDIIAGLAGRDVRVAVVVLDACRNNPFKPARPGLKGVGVEKGLAPPPQVRGVFSLYAAGSGQGALDQLYDGDANPNSVFSRVLVPALTQSGRDLTALAVDVRQEVARIAQGAGYDQQPAYYDGLTGRFYLAGLPAEKPGTPPALTVAPVSEAAQAWTAVQNSPSLAVIDDFIQHYGNAPVYGALARAKREELVKKPASQPEPQVAMIETPARRSGAAPLTAGQERGLKAKDPFRECADCPEMVVVPAGSFAMGSPDGEKDRNKDEGPQHVVTVGKPFAAGKLHVTVDQFAVFVRETGYKASTTCLKWASGGSRDGSWRDPGFAQDGTHPVVCVSWDDATAYVGWLAKKTGKPYRLLTEAEFEYAARGRTSPGAYPRFWFGDNEKDLCRYGNFWDQKAGVKDAPCNDGFDRTSPAGHYAANAFGLYDMAGNAWQWTEDCYHDSYAGAPADGSAWTTGACNSGRVVRGGSWVSGPRYLRAAQRDGGTVGIYDVGFRLARTLTP
jgi:formylglycine-generating enzyme required for sulfatase activity